MLSFSLSVIFGVVFSLLSMKIAPKFGLVDKPDHRKHHDGHIPLAGGIAMFLAFTSTLLLLGTDIDTGLIWLGGALLVVVGVWDDLSPLRARYRFSVQILSALVVVLAGHQILSIGDLFNIGALQLGWLSLPFTVFCVLGLINASNMTDGMDGLASAMGMLSALGLVVVATLNSDVIVYERLLIFIGLLAAFSFFNMRLVRSKACVFMGDAGSTFIGYMLAWHFISISQGDTAYLSPVAAGWIYGIPLMDASAVILRRVKNGISPFKSGRDHLHHLLLDRGFSVNATLLVMSLLQLSFVGIGLMCAYNPEYEYAFFWLFVGVTLIHLSNMPVTRLESRKQESSMVSPQ